MQDKLDKNPDAVDHRPKARMIEHRNIPTMQPWQYLLDNKYAPYIVYTWFDYLRTDPAAHNSKIF